MGVEGKLKKEILDEKLAKANTEEEKKQAQDISAEEWHTKARANFSQALDAEYGFGIASKPSKEAFAVEILKRQTGWSEERIRSEQREVAYREAYGRRGARTRHQTQTLLEEFLYRADNHYYKPVRGAFDVGQFRLARVILPSRIELNAGMALEQAEEDYNRALTKRALGTARMNLWQQDKPWTQKNIDVEVARLVANHRVKTQDEFIREKERVELRQLIESIIVPGLNNFDAAIVAFKDGQPKEGIKNLLIGLVIFVGTRASARIGGGYLKPQLVASRSRQILADNIAHGFDMPLDELDVAETRSEPSKPPDIIETIPQKKDVSIPSQFAELKVHETGEYLHPIKNEKYTVTWIRFFDENGKPQLRLSLLRRKLGSSRSYTEVDWQTGDPIAAWRTIYKQADGEFIAGGLAGGGPKKAPKGRGKPAGNTEGSREGASASERADTSQSGPSQGDRETYLSTIGDQKFQSKVKQLLIARRGRMTIEELETIAKASDEGIARKLKNLEVEIGRLIERKGPSEQIDTLFQSKARILTIRWMKKLNLLHLYDATNPDLYLRIQNIWGALEKDSEPLTFFDRHPEANEIMHGNKDISDAQFQENEAQILRLEQEGNKNPEVLEKLYGKQINKLFADLATSEEENNFLKSLNLVMEYNGYITRLLKLWKEYPVPENMTSHEIYKLAHDHLLPIGKKRAYLSHYLNSRLEAADRERGTVTPRDANGRIDVIEGNAWDKVENKKNLVAELEKSPFGRYLVGVRFNLSTESEEAFEIILRNGKKEDMRFICQSLDYLSDLANFEGDCRPWAEKLIEASELAQDATTAATMVERLMKFQDLMKRLLNARKAKNEALENLIQKLLMADKDRLNLQFFEYGRIGYLKIQNKLMRLRNQSPAELPANQSIQAREAQLLPGGRPLGRRMDILSDWGAYSFGLIYLNDWAKFVESESARFSLEIDEDLLQSQALKEKIDQFKSTSEVEIIEEESPEDTPGDYRIPLEPVSGGVETSVSPQPSGEPVPESAGPSTRPKPSAEPVPDRVEPATRPKPPAERTELDDKVDRYIALYFWSELKGGILKGKGPSMEIETSRNTPITLTLGGLRHILKRHYPKTMDPTLLQTGNSRMASSLSISELIPMIRQLGENMDRRQLGIHYDIMGKNPSSPIPVRSRIATSYKGQPYWICLKNSRITSIFPNDKQ